jgi:hypothetical protein
MREVIVKKRVRKQKVNLKVKKKLKMNVDNKMVKWKGNVRRTDLQYLVT